MSASAVSGAPWINRLIRQSYTERTGDGQNDNGDFQDNREPSRDDFDAQPRPAQQEKTCPEFTLGPGNIQSFGALVALRPNQSNDAIHLPVDVVSENAFDILGYQPAALFGLLSFIDIVADSQKDFFLNHINTIILDPELDPGASGLEVWPLDIQLPTGLTRPLWCVISRQQDLILCEFEKQESSAAPEETGGRCSPSEEGPSSPECAPAEITPRPRLRRRRTDQKSLCSLIGNISKADDRLLHTNDVQQLLETATTLIHGMTGFDHVMIYQFHPDWSGQVMTEAKGPGAGQTSYNGLHFPATFLPQEMRDVYEHNRIHLLHDRTAPVFGLFYRQEGNVAIDPSVIMNSTYLRAMHPFQLGYLASMGVQSNICISIKVRDRLWGLIVCHSYRQREERVPFMTLRNCILVGNSISMNIERLTHEPEAKTLSLPEPQPYLAGQILSSAEGLLDLFMADFGVISIGNEIRLLSRREAALPTECFEWLNRLKRMQIWTVRSSNSLQQEFGMKNSPVSGYLYIPISAGEVDCMVLFRKCESKKSSWVQDPYRHRTVQGFDPASQPVEAFQIHVILNQTPGPDWQESDLQHAEALSFLFTLFIEVWRENEATVRQTRMTELLLKNSAHELRTPLNAVINYLELALEKSLDPGIQHCLTQASFMTKSVFNLIDDLTDLTKSKKELLDIQYSRFGLRESLGNVLSLFRAEADRKHIRLQLLMQEDTEVYVHGNRRYLQSAIAAILTNAFTATTKGTITLEYAGAADLSGVCQMAISVRDTGRGISSGSLARLSGAVNTIITGFQPTHQPPTLTLQSPGHRSSSPLGSGLTLVSHVLSHYDGRLEIESKKRSGSLFRLVMRMPIAAD
ncbi:hypothetical protein ASPZODRAFT_145973 [Penicilliopsis zonata CBS 506.65]|uniref:Histidine kinase domain-containing protein n=1 Tax=Penicilliopsis zonata CBS 506.65 TaxID=1073090 RepID=A0A1L9S8Y6_9EURO|nr:hypothetical protein ASPZODRAFT_145973 [Penicilliopsis zonata CBS 506.65]OJJ43623.1 hypothetical protein ASPZODRAFT_145973 [Penicilliopsis zonata CBS 506.65]